mmetsp:Transcript_22668/g.41010  ORF Transcript_22668/g.41010 Transcript_22668/m.41010 type:complete len:263 (-) Transcript_22668:6-794(-)
MKSMDPLPSLSKTRSTASSSVAEISQPILRRAERSSTRLSSPLPSASIRWNMSHSHKPSDLKTLTMVSRAFSKGALLLISFSFNARMSGSTSFAACASKAIAAGIEGLLAAWDGLRAMTFGGAIIMFRYGAALHGGLPLNSLDAQQLEQPQIISPEPIACCSITALQSKHRILSPLTFAVFTSSWMVTMLFPSDDGRLESARPSAEGARPRDKGGLAKLLLRRTSAGFSEPTLTKPSTGGGRSAKVLAMASPLSSAGLLFSV